MQRMALIIWMFIISLAIPCKLFAEELEIEADKVDKIKNRIEATGNVVIKGREGMTLTANYMSYDSETMDIWASGDCHLNDSRGEIRAETLAYNVKRKDASVGNGYIYDYQEPFKIWGESIARYSNDVYLGDKIRYSPCNAEKPDWSIGAKHLDVPVEGYGKAKHAWFYIKDIPVFYFPYLYFPAKLERQSGILFPTAGSMSDTGYYAGLPLYLTLGRPADLTLTPAWLEKRGLIVASELRYTIDYKRKGYVYFEGLRDKWGGDIPEAGVEPIIPYSRWYLKADNTGGDLTWNINLPSNADYFRDIGVMYPIETEQESLWVGTQPSRTEEAISRAEWMKTWGRFMFNINAQWKKDMNVSDNSFTIQQLPSARIKMSQIKIPMTPLYISADVNSINIYSGESAQGIKDYANVELSLPLNILPYFTIRPWIQEIYRDTHFRQKGPIYEDFDSDINEHWNKRGVSLTTSIYSPRFSGGWYHQILPSAEWSCLSKYDGNYDVAPGDADYPYPVILSGDAWQKADDIKLSLSNFIRDQSASSRVEATLSRTYSRIIEDWSYFEGVLRFNLWPWMYLEHTNTFGEDEHNAFISKQNKTSLHLSNSRKDELTLTSEYLRNAGSDSANSLYGNARLSVFDSWWLFFEGKYNFTGDRFEFARQGIDYKSQCWGVMGSVMIEPSYELMPGVKEPTKTTYNLTVSFLGLGDVSAKHKETSGTD